MLFHQLKALPTEISPQRIDASLDSILGEVLGEAVHFYLKTV